jgi:hypothetical protein
MKMAQNIDNAISEALDTKTAATSQNANKLHGAGGLFESPALEREVISAHMTPKGIGSILPILPTVYEDPRFGSITGFTDVTGSEPTAVCADAPYGYMKGAMLTARFGLVRRDTNTIDMGKVMLKASRGDHGDLTLAGRLLGISNLKPSDLDEQGVLNILTKAEMVGAGVQAERKLSRDIWQGVLNQNNAFPGFDVQIATGQKDADSGVAAPALDSDVKDFNYDKVGGTGRDIVEYLSMLEFYLRTNAEGMGLDPVTWVVAMRPELWFELSAVWPCSYLSSRCNLAGSTTNPIVINDNANVAMRDAMRQGMFIDINGNRYTVVTDSGIYEATNITTASLKAGEYASAIYMIPLTIQGNMPVTYREYLNYSLATGDIGFLNGKENFWTDGGIYSWAIEKVKWCYKLSLRTEQRVILRTPQLAGKIQRVKYSPLQHIRSPYPDDPYFRDGGVSVRGHTFGQAVWA